MEYFKKTSVTFFPQQIQRYRAEQQIQSRKFPIRGLVCKSVGIFSRVASISTVLLRWTLNVAKCCRKTLVSQMVGGLLVVVLHSLRLLVNNSQCNQNQFRVFGNRISCFWLAGDFFNQIYVNQRESFRNIKRWYCSLNFLFICSVKLKIKIQFLFTYFAMEKCWVKP